MKPGFPETGFSGSVVLCYHECLAGLTPARHFHLSK